eukprot:COSAG01_NODE_63816_length_278_cov_1.731844_1_plen_48_part_10
MKRALLLRNIETQRPAARDEWTAEVLGAPHAGNLSRCAVSTTKLVIGS